MVDEGKNVLAGARETEKDKKEGENKWETWCLLKEGSIKNWQTKHQQKHQIKHILDLAKDTRKNVSEEKLFTPAVWS